jgi:hypothetical protein
VDTHPQMPFTCTLEFRAEDSADPDPATLATLATAVVTEVEEDGATVKPLAPETGTRGGPELLFQVAWHSLQTVGADMLAQKDTIDILASLCTTFATVGPLVTRLFRTHKQQAKKGQQGKLYVSITVDQGTIEITSDDVADDERIVQLAQRFLAANPTAKISPASKVKVQARVSQQKQRKHTPRHRR